MTDTAGLLRLLSWLSPVFPTGGFAYSSGLEAAAQTGVVKDETELGEWLSALLQYGSLRNDALFLVSAFEHNRNPASLQEIAELAVALAGSSRRYLECTAQGDAFIKAVRNWPKLNDLNFPKPCPLAVAVGAAAGRSTINLQSTLNAYLHAFVSNQLQAAIRLSIIGQSAAARLLAQLEASILAMVETVENGSLEDLGSAAIMADIMAMKHEELEGRLFRS